MTGTPRNDPDGRRRRALLCAGGSLLAALAGCSAATSDDDPTARTTTSDTTPTTGAEPTATRTTAETTRTTGPETTDPGTTEPTTTQASPSYALEQGDRCVPIEPLTAEQTIEEFYAYRAPFTEPEGQGYSAHGHTDLQRGSTSRLFLYRGPEGLSLVIIHGKWEGDGDGAAISFTISGLPEDGSWVVHDDLYDSPSNYDQWDTNGTTHRIDWLYRDARTDGGAFRDLGEEFELTIDPAFNEDAALHDEDVLDPASGIDEWEALSGSVSDPERISLLRDAPVRLRSGSC